MTPGSVLVLDSDRTRLLAAADALHGAGFSPLIASSVWQALVTGHLHEPGLLVAEARLPCGTPGSHVRRVLESRWRRRIPSIFLAYPSELDTLARCDARGRTAYIAKPIDAERLVAEASRLAKPRDLKRRAASAGRAEPLRYDPGSFLLRLGSKTAELTSRESELLLELAAHRKETRGELAGRLWSQSENRSTVDVNVRRLRLKLAKLAPRQLVALGHGVFKLQRPVRIQRERRFKPPL